MDVGVVDALLADLTARGIRLKVVDGKLGYDAPPGVFGDALKERVRRLRHALIARLGGRPIVAPLSPGQERMWFLNRLEGRASGNPWGSYTEHLAYALNGPLDRDALEGALSAVTARHGALRSLFRDGPEGPEQVVAPPDQVRLRLIDLGAAPGPAAGSGSLAAKVKPPRVTKSCGTPTNRGASGFCRLRQLVSSPPRTGKE